MIILLVNPLPVSRYKHWKVKKGQTTSKNSFKNTRIMSFVFETIGILSIVLSQILLSHLDQILVEDQIQFHLVIRFLMKSMKPENKMKDNNKLIKMMIEI